jgi:hypothetical protein
MLTASPGHTPGFPVAPLLEALVLPELVVVPLPLVAVEAPPVPLELTLVDELALTDELPPVEELPPVDGLPPVEELSPVEELPPPLPVPPLPSG